MNEPKEQIRSEHVIKALHRRTQGGEMSTLTDYQWAQKTLNRLYLELPAPAIFHIADRINLFDDIKVYLNVLKRLKENGINAVSISNHEKGGQKTLRDVEATKTVLKHCKDLNMEVYMACMNGSKWDAGSPTGLMVKSGAAHRPKLDYVRIDDHRVRFRMRLMANRLYQFSYAANGPCTPFLFDTEDENWQMIRYKTAAVSDLLEIPTVSGSGYYDIIFKGSPGLKVDMTRPVAVTNPESLSMTLNEWGAVQGRTFKAFGLWYYRGGETVTGNGFCNTPNYADFESRRIARKETFGWIAKTYADFIGDPIVGSYLKWDEFNMLGDLCDGSDMVNDIKLCAAISDALIGPALIDMRHLDYGSHTRCNRKDAALNAYWYIGTENGALPISWAEETTPEIAADAKAHSSHDALAGVYLDKGNPQHFKDAGFNRSAIYWWPEGDQTWDDLPYDKLREVAEVFA